MNATCIKMMRVTRMSEKCLELGLKEVEGYRGW